MILYTAVSNAACKRLLALLHMLLLAVWLYILMLAQCGSVIAVWNAMLLGMFSAEVMLKCVVLAVLSAMIFFFLALIF